MNVSLVENNRVNSSNYIFPKWYPGMFPIAGHSFQVRKLKLGVNDHLMGADVTGYQDIRISAFEIFGFFPIVGPCGLNFEAIIVKLGVNDYLIGTDVSGHPDIWISAFEIFGFFLDFRPLCPQFQSYYAQTWSE